MSVIGKPFASYYKKVLLAEIIFIFNYRVNKEEENLEQVTSPKNEHDNIFVRYARQLAHNDERLMYIYVFTGIIITTVIITLFRSFLFFNVSRQFFNSNIKRK